MSEWTPSPTQANKILPELAELRSLADDLVDPVYFAAVDQAVAQYADIAERKAAAKDADVEAARFANDPKATPPARAEARAKASALAEDVARAERVPVTIPSQVSVDQHKREVLRLQRVVVVGNPEFRRRWLHTVQQQSMVHHVGQVQLGSPDELPGASAAQVALVNTWPRLVSDVALWARRANAFLARLSASSDSNEKAIGRLQEAVRVVVAGRKLEARCLEMADAVARLNDEERRAGH